MHISSFCYHLLNSCMVFSKLYFKGSVYVAIYPQRHKQRIICNIPIFCNGNMLHNIREIWRAKLLTCFDKKNLCFSFFAASGLFLYHLM